MGNLENLSRDEFVEAIIAMLPPELAAEVMEIHEKRCERELRPWL